MKNYSSLASVLLSLVLTGCGSSDNDSHLFFGIALPPLTHTVSNFQVANVVVGQVNFLGSTANQGGPADANTLDNPLGRALTYRGSLWLGDTDNNRVLGFNRIPTMNNALADFVLGQPDFTTTTPGVSASLLSGPLAIRVGSNGRFYTSEFVVARVLIWDSPPTSGGVPASVVVGQPDMASSNNVCTQSGFGGQLGEVLEVNGKLLVANFTDSRVLIWNSVPTNNGAPADIVLGQNSFTNCEGNDDNQDGINEGAPTARTLTSAYGLWSDGTRLVVSDSLNHRVLIWTTFPTASFQPANLVLGQNSFTTNVPNDDDQNGANDGVASARTFNRPLGVDSNGTKLFVADAENNRVLVWNTFPTTNFQPADVVLGQSNFTNIAVNDDDQDGVEDVTTSARVFNFPTAVELAGTDNRLIITDTNNSRFLIFYGQ
jgi:hypothetical protein